MSFLSDVSYSSLERRVTRLEGLCAGSRWLRYMSAFVGSLVGSFLGIVFTQFVVALFLPYVRY